MTDNRTPESRSALMGRIRGKNTEPEFIVRRLLHGMGYRFRLHRKDLPGTPDIVLPGRGKAIFVHGCFWHGHGCKIGRAPKSRLEYWLPKLAENKRRDDLKRAALEALGWRVLTVWQCETRNPQRLATSLKEFLDAEESDRHPVPGLLELPQHTDAT